MKIYIPTCNKTIYLVEALLYSLRKYWTSFEEYDVVIVGYEKPKFDLDENVSFHSMGTHDPVKNWAIDLKNYFKNIDDEHFIYMNDDSPLSRNIDEDLLRLFLNLISIWAKTDIGRICLTKDASNRAHDVVADYGDFQLINSHQNTKYRTSTQFSIWNRKYFLKYLRNNMTPWQFELQHPQNDGHSILGTKGRCCLDFYHLRRKFGTPTEWNISNCEGRRLADNADDYNFVTKVMKKGRQG